MRIAYVVTKTSFEIFVSVILLHFLKSDYVEAGDDCPDATDSNFTDSISITRKTCVLKPDPGPCRGSIVMYFFDPAKRDCKRFYWGGCQGNGNRFDTRDECYSSCIRNNTIILKRRPRYCNLNFDYGFCFGAIPRYYYDHLWKVCKERLYSGCGGNKNNFYNIEQCDSICRYGNGFIKSTKLKKGEVRKVLIINPKHFKTTKKADRHIQTKHVREGNPPAETEKPATT